jgi:PAS domain S-box-containing protein
MSDAQLTETDPQAELCHLRRRVAELEERKADLRQELAMLRAVAEANEDIVFVKDRDGRYLYVNAAAAALVNRSVEDVIGHDTATFFDPVSAARDCATDLEVLTTGRPVTFETDATAGGTVVRLLTTKAPLRNGRDEVVGVVGVSRDVTARRRAEAALRASEARFRAFVDHSPAPAWITDTHGRFVYLNATCQRTLRLPPGDPVGRTVFDLFTESHAREYMANNRAAAAYGTVVEAEEPCVRADGSAGWFLVYRFPLPEDDGPTLVGGVAVDITDRTRTEVALRQSEQRYRELFRTSPLPMWIYDTRTLRFLAVNQAAVQQYGYSEEEFLGLTLKDIRPREDVAALLAALPQLPPVASHGVWRHRTKDERIIDVEVNSHTLHFDGRPARCVLSRDVTEQRRLEGQLRQAQKMEAVGRLAGGVAHDFNNLLTAILGFTEVLLDGLKPERITAIVPNDLRGAAEEVRKAGEKAADLTRQLLAFSRRQILQARVLDLSGVVSDMENILRRVIGEDVTLETVRAAESLPVLADPGQLERVILNLAVNARDAMPNGGRLTITTAAANLGPDDLHEHPELRPGEYAVLSVCDTGVGMDAATKARLFEPFFTTKKVGEGTGLGLATVYGVVKQSGGDISVRTAPGEGTTFTLYLPTSNLPAAGGKPRETPPSAPTAAAQETVLVVEDDDAVRVLVRLVLTRQGYQVLEARDGESALALVESYDQPIHLLVSDVVMPGVSGPELAAKVTAQRPDLRVMFLSGYTEDEVIRRGGGTAAFLHKPFLPTALTVKVREVLNGQLQSLNQ